MANEVKTVRLGIYDTLSRIDISQYIKKKNGNSYLPWASCWNLVLSRYPHSTYKVNGQEISIQNPFESHYTRPWFTNGTGWVEVEVHVVDDYVDEQDGSTYKESVSHIETYPILDLKNKSLPEDQITTADVNKSIKRGLVKAVATCTGLGLHLFYGEDLPDEMARIIELQSDIKEAATKKSGLSDKAKETTIELCKNAERKANPDWDEELITGQVGNIEDIEILKDLYKQILKVRK